MLLASYRYFDGSAILYDNISSSSLTVVLHEIQVNNLGVMYCEEDIIRQ